MSRRTVVRIDLYVPTVLLSRLEIAEAELNIALREFRIHNREEGWLLNGRSTLVPKK